MSKHNNLVLTTKHDLHDDFFKKSHDIVFSQLKLTPREHDLMALFLSRLHTEHWSEYEQGKKIDTIPTYVFDSSSICDWLGIEPTAIYSTLVPVANRLAGRTVGIRNDSKKEFDIKSLFMSISYRESKLVMHPNPHLMAEYLGISQGHAQVNRTVFLSCKSENSKRLYSILSRFKSKKFRLHPLSIEDLYGLFGFLNKKGELTRSTYKSVPEFIKQVIKKSIKEIDKFDSSIQFELSEKGDFGFRKIKSGRSIVGIEFLFSWKKGDTEESNISSTSSI